MVATYRAKFPILSGQPEGRYSSVLFFLVYVIRKTAGRLTGRAPASLPTAEGFSARRWKILRLVGSPRAEDTSRLTHSPPNFMPNFTPMTRGRITVWVSSACESLMNAMPRVSVRF